VAPQSLEVTFIQLSEVSLSWREVCYAVGLICWHPLVPVELLDSVMPFFLCTVLSAWQALLPALQLSLALADLVVPGELLDFVVPSLLYTILFAWQAFLPAVQLSLLL